jgi:hypothetical protein
MRIVSIIVLVLAALAGLGCVHYYWPRSLLLPAPGIAQIIDTSGNATSVYIPDRVLIGELAQFDDGLFAFLMFDYVRGRPALAGSAIMLTSHEEQGRPIYHILLRLPNDLISGVDFLAQLKADRLASGVRYDWIRRSKLDSNLHETSVFFQAYNGSATEHLRTLHASELQGYLRRFFRFKSETDPRIAGTTGPIPSPLTQKDASRLAADIIAVAHFYDLPIELFVGIGAMENNYMNVAGDLKNTIWKRRAEPGDIVLRRKRGRVLVRNDSMGVWQITRESLRYAHKLYRRDKRDYTQLPERLRPPEKLDFNSIDADVLTTYAGLLLRDLLDRFHGDVALAAGAYNGGPAKPNPHYAEGVETVANYARRVIGRAAAIDRLATEENSVSAQKINTAPGTLQEETRASASGDVH